MKSNRKQEEQGLLDGTEVAGLPGLTGLAKDWGSNLQRLQQLFGGQQRDPSATPPVPSGPTKNATEAPAPKPKGLDAPMLDQHEFQHWNRGAFCGLATTAMMLQANGQDAGTSTQDLNHYASQMYINKQGSSGDLMARYLRRRGIKDSTFTTKGNTSRMVETLQQGQTVPFGVVLCQGEVTKIEGGRSANYPNRRVGDRHYRKFGNAGHWVLVTRFEGKPEKPTAFYVNDPDLGGELRCSPADLEAMGKADGQYWMIEQR